ncbi:DNA/RNA non-specific endonuclease, partial [Myxococcus sp. CA040A]
TDSRGRVSSVEGDLYLVPDQVRSESAQSRGNKEYLVDKNGRRVPLKVQTQVDGRTVQEHLKYRHDEGGHLIGAQFGGPPEFLNYVPQTRYQNGSVTNRSDDPRTRLNDENAPPGTGPQFFRNWYEF